MKGLGSGFAGDAAGVLGAATATAEGDFGSSCFMLGFTGFALPRLAADAGDAEPLPVALLPFFPDLGGWVADGLVFDLDASGVLVARFWAALFVSVDLAALVFLLTVFFATDFLLAGAFFLTTFTSAAPVLVAVTFDKGFLLLEDLVAFFATTFLPPSFETATLAVVFFFAAFFFAMVPFLSLLASVRTRCPEGQRPLSIIHRLMVTPHVRHCRVFRFCARL